ncbi:MAG: diaminopimelate epimerase [Marinicaulis sp.]|nr:diaminopimelate epimerase [Marinicaulis sp.]
MNEFSGAPYKLMNGLGNKFAIFDLRNSEKCMSPDTARQIADPNIGPGCDQVITIEHRSGFGGVFMGIWNADGAEVAACGNAARCVASILMQETGEENATFNTLSNVLTASAVGERRICIDMGEPELSWRKIPLAEQMDDTRFIDIKLGPIDNPVLWGPSAVNVGNPHCVFFVENVDDHAIDKFGPLVENHPLFPERANVSIAEVNSKHSIRVRVWERGVGVTKACGTAACAALVSAHRRRLAARKATVTLDGGDLAIEWREDNHITMTGEYSYDGDGVLPELE